VLLASVESPSQRPEDEAILNEILALRKIVIKQVYGQAAGQSLDEERMRELIEAADAEKLAKALERLQALRTARTGVLSNRERGIGEHSFYLAAAAPRATGRRKSEDCKGWDGSADGVGTCEAHCSGHATSPCEGGKTCGDQRAASSGRSTATCPPKRGPVR